MLTIIEPAEDLNLLTLEERRVAAGLAADDDSRDPELADLSLEAAEWIASLCGIPVADGMPPTVLRERLLETLMVSGCRRSLVLSRRFVWVSETDDAPFTVLENNTELETAAYQVDANSGRLYRLVGGTGMLWWACGTVTVEYTAGIDPMAIPPAIKRVARDYMRMQLNQADLDPLERSVTVEGLDSVTYRDSTDGAGSFKVTAIDRLARYMAPIPV